MGGAIFTLRRGCEEAVVRQVAPQAVCTPTCTQKEGADWLESKETRGRRDISGVSTCLAVGGTLDRSCDVTAGSEWDRCFQENATGGAVKSVRVCTRSTSLTCHTAGSVGGLKAHGITTNPTMLHFTLL